MRRLVTILFLLLTSALSAQTVSEVSIAEYKSGFLDTEGRAWLPYWVNGQGTRAVQVGGSMRFTMMDGAQYNHVLLRNNGGVYQQNNGSTTLTYLQYDSEGNTFTAVYVEAYFQCYIAIGTNGKIYARGYNHYKWFGSNVNTQINAWTLIPNQPDVTFVKTRKGGAQGSGHLVALTNTGAVYTVADNTTTWNLKSFPGAVDDIHASFNGFYIAMIDGLPYGWGQRRYLTGVTGNISTYDALADNWGLGEHTIIDIALNDNTIHYITDDNKLWGFGDNAMGEVGVGWELVNRKELYNGDWYIWNWIGATQGSYQSIAFVTTPTQLRPDKQFKRVWASDYFAYYCFAQDVDDDMYFWGRNKGAVGFTGKGAANEATLPNSMDVLEPTLVDIFNTVVTTPSNFVPGTVDAGSNKTISTSSTTLTGSATAGHTNNWSYSISSYEWTKVSGPSCTIVSPSSASTSITGMSDGVYTFRLKITDNNTATYTDDITVTVALDEALNIVASGEHTSGDTATLSATVTGENIAWTKWTVLTRPDITPFKIFIGGSSTAAGSTGVTSVDSAWPFIYKRFLKEYGLLDTMYHRALGGTETRHGLPSSTNGYSVSSFDTTRNITYAIRRGVHLAMGCYASNGYPGVPIANHLAWYRETRDSAEANGVLYYVTTTQPRPAYNTTDEQKLKTTADSLRVQFNYVEFYKPFVTPGTMDIRPEFNYGDGIHVNNAGQRAGANNVIGTNPLASLTQGTAVFADANSANTTVTGLTPGTWRFLASAQDENGFTVYQVVEIEVPEPPANVPPAVDAGEDQDVEAAYTTLSATAEDSDGTITSYTWSKVSGPDDDFIAEPSSASTQVTFTRSGTYVYKIMVFDNDGASGEDTVTITVTVPRVPAVRIKRHGKLRFTPPES